MNRLMRWLLRLVIGLFALTAVGALVVWVLVSGSLPRYSGEVLAEGLNREVEIVRDANAVPHIRAQSDRDAWFALGLVHAQDRLWQMEVGRRAAQGRLSEFFGARTVGLDRMVRTYDIYGHARRSFAHQTPETQAALEAYADGVNAWIRHANDEALGRGAPEFFLFTDGLAPWVPADSLGILKMMALRLTGAAAEEVRRAKFQLALEPARVADILPDYPGKAVTSPARFAAYPELFPNARFATRPATPTDPLVAALGPAPAPELAGASNAWAVDGTRSSGRKPLLANDPHLWLSAPSVWYLADIHGPSLKAIGGTLAGVPAVLIGHNGRVGWGLTTAQVDDQDIFIEQLNPADPDQYQTPEGWQSFATRQIVIEVDGAPTLTETVRISRHGPVIPDNQFDVDAITPEGHVAALRWTALTDKDTGLSALHEIVRAGSVDTALAAADLAVAPAQVVTLADRNGVAMVLAGAVPERDPDSPARGRLPVPGWKPGNDWLGLREAILNPRVIRPPEGAVANANNRLTDAPYPAHISHDWAPPYRIQRIEKELAARKFHSRDSFVALQTDTVSEMARTVLPLIARDLWWREGQAAGTGMRAEALALLAYWNGEMDQHAPEPLIFMEWMRQLTRRLAADELGGLYRDIAGPRPLFVERVYRDVEGAAVWCDVDKTPEEETCAQIAAVALDDALAVLSAEHGTRVEGWRWGIAHRAVHRHTPLGYAGPVGFLFNIEHETSGGNHTLMRGMTTGQGKTPYANVHASGLRVVLDFADLDRSVMMMATGQSGHPLSRWYDHLAEPWSRGDVIPMSMDDEDARAGAVGTMILRPAP